MSALRSVKGASAKRYVALAATATGTGNIAFTTSFSAQWELLNLTILFDADAQNDVLLTLDANAGTAYDAQFVAITAAGLTKIWYDPKEDKRRMLFTEDDELLVSWTNPASVTYRRKGSWMYDLSYDETVINQYASIDVNSSGDNELVAAVSGRVIKVLQIEYTGHGGVLVKLKSGTTDLEGVMGLLYGTGKVRSGTRSVPAFKTATGEALNLNLSDAVRVVGSVVYTTQDTV